MKKEHSLSKHSKFAATVSLFQYCRLWLSVPIRFNLCIVFILPGEQETRFTADSDQSRVINSENSLWCSRRFRWKGSSFFSNRSVSEMIMMMKMLKPPRMKRGDNTEEKGDPDDDGLLC